MNVYLITLLPIALFFLIFILELFRQKRYSMLWLATLLMVAIGFHFASIASIMATGKHPFPYSPLINRVLTVCILPTFFVIGNLSVGKHMPRKTLAMLYAPAVFMFFVSFIPGSFVLGQSIGEVTDFHPTLLIKPYGHSIGWGLLELVIVIQSIAAMVMAVHDYNKGDGKDLRTDTINSLIKTYGTMAAALFVQSFVGCANWMMFKDYALVDVCFNSFVFSYTFHLLHKNACERRYMIEDEGDYESLLSMESIANDVGGIGTDSEKEQKTPNSSVDFGTKPEIPREENNESPREENSTPLAFEPIVTPQDISMPIEGEPSAKELLAIELRTLIEQEKIYLQAGIKIDEVALTLGTNRTYLAKIMKQVYGHTFSEYMNICRLRSAQADMLTRKNVSIETIALSNGFNSSNTFNKVFNQFHGCSPAVWRKNAMQ